MKQEKERALRKDGKRGSSQLVKAEKKRACLIFCYLAGPPPNAKFYRQLDGDITDTIQQRVTVYIERMFNDGYIDKKTKKYLVQTNVKPGRFYILPKIHKAGNPGCPIVLSNSHPTEHISHSLLTTTMINPLVSTLDSHI